MQIKDIRIDRFGRCSDLSLDALANELNVVCGPVGSGKTAVSQFVQAILYGFDSGTRQRYLPSESRGFGGSLAVHDRDGYQTISRSDDGSVDGRLTIEHEDGTLIGRRHVPNAVSDTAQTTFDRVFCVDHRRRPGIGALIEEGQNRGFDLVGNIVDTDRIEWLEAKLRELRDALATVPRIEPSHETLSVRRVELLRAISSLEARLSDQPDEPTIRRQIVQLEAQLSVVQTSLERVRDELAQAEQARRNLLSRHGGAAKVHGATSATLDGLNRVSEQLNRWQTVLREVATRRQRIEEQADDQSSAEVDSSPRHWLGEAESQLDDLQSALHSLDDSRSYSGHEIRELLASGLGSVREDLYRLCSALSYWEVSRHQRDCASEIVGLTRCETELQQAIKGLSARRSKLQIEIAAGKDWDNSSLAPWHESLCECAEHPSLQLQPVANDRSDESDRELGAITDRIATLQCEQHELVAEIDKIEAEFDDLRADLHRIERADVLEQLDARRADLRRVDQGLRDIERRRELLSEIAEVEDELRSLETQHHSSGIIAEASEFLRRLSAGDLRSIEVAANEQVWVVDEHGRRRAYHQLSDGGRDLVYASICFALAEAYRLQGIQLPLLISGLFTNVDSKNVPEAAELLRDFAARGHQVILFTRHEHVANVFRLLNVPIRELDAIPGVEHVAAEERVIDDSYSTEEVDEIGLADGLWESEESSGELTDRVRLEDIDSDVDVDRHVVSGTEHFLTEHSAIEDAPSIDAANAERLRKIGVMRVGDLLGVSAKEAAGELRYAGISADTIRSWQAQCRLMCQVPRLRSYDARILVACGITDAAELYRSSASELRDRVKELAASSNGQTVMLSGTEFELSRLTDWINTARIGGSDSGTETSRTKESSSSRSGRRDRGVGARSRSDRSRSHRSSRSSDRSRKQDRSRRERRGSERTPHKSTTDSDVIRMESAETKSEWKFYLKRSDAVVDAPSIGARTAERLEAIEIRTVADLLDADADAITEGLDNRRFSTKVITQWQQQTELVCRVPQLRGHDAQLLVALEITEPEQLASCDPQELWTEMEPFVETKEGKRIIRNGKTPDLEEVTEWIQWAQSARKLNAA
ncbi:MAG: hypothetical protein CMJ64_19885 [Planctomycetaceae bacterium]|nr:hypothetical protein [Planctomycetaceae bacterium]